MKLSGRHCSLSNLELPEPDPSRSLDLDFFTLDGLTGPPDLICSFLPFPSSFSSPRPEQEKYFISPLEFISTLISYLAAGVIIRVKEFAGLELRWVERSFTAIASAAAARSASRPSAHSAAAGWFSLSATALQLFCALKKVKYAKMQSFKGIYKLCALWCVSSQLQPAYVSNTSYIFDIL